MDKKEQAIIFARNLKELIESFEKFTDRFSDLIEGFNYVIPKETKEIIEAEGKRLLDEESST